MNGEIEVSVRKLKHKKKVVKVTKIVVLSILLVLFLSYVVMNIIYNNGNFSITLDKNLYFSRGIVIYDDPDYKVFRTELYAKAVDYFDNISYKWLPEDLDKTINFKEEYSKIGFLKAFSKNIIPKQAHFCPFLVAILRKKS